jgi:hypothetical protein
MDERISFVSHHGQKVMVIDFTGGEPKELLLLLEEIQRSVARHEHGSLLTLVDLTGAHIDRTVATRMKEVLVLDRPFVKRSAWVGVETLPKAYYDNFRTFSQREFPPFRTRAEAMEWLVRD